MSGQAVRWARGKASSVTAQCVLYALADYCDPHGITYVGQASLAAACSCGERTVRENLIRLEQEWLITRIPRRDHRGHRSSDYTVLGPLAIDREGMPDLPETDVATGRYPADVAEVAHECDDREWADMTLCNLLRRLPADDAGRAEKGAPPLPADDAIPTGTSLHPYRQLTPSLPAPAAGETLVKVQVDPRGNALEAEQAQPEGSEVRPSAALGRAFPKWARLLRPDSNVQLTEKRAKAYYSRLKHDSTEAELDAVIEAAHLAVLRDDVFDYPHRDTEWFRLFMDREHVEAFLKYGETDDPYVLFDMLAMEAPREREAAGEQQANPFDEPADGRAA